MYCLWPCANRAQLATAWSTGDTCTVCGHPTMSNYFTSTRDTCTVCGHPTMSNYFTMYSYKIVGVLAFQLSLLLLFKQLQIGSTHVLFVATPLLQIGSTHVLFVATPLLQIGSTHVLFVATTIHVSKVHILN